MQLKSFVAGIVVGGGLFGTFAAAARLNVVSGVIGVRSGYGQTTAICVDANAEIANGAKIETIFMPIGDGAGRTATGVTFRCP